MKLKEIHRTATFAWSPLPSVPLLVSGTVAGALDESFSNESQLEIWAPDFLDKAEYDLGREGHVGPKASVTTSSRFNRVAWGFPNNLRSQGIVAAGMENGELGLWDPEKLLATSNATESLILRNTTHQGSVRGLDFNPIQTSLLSSGATNGEIYIWDLKDPGKPYSPGSRSSKLDEITALSWNRQVQHVLASSSSTGYTVVWDLRNKREVVALAYGGAGQSQNIFGAGGRKGMSDVAWHPDNATRLVTSSEDDNSPVVMVWDLRNARAPEKILTGHERGILSLSWCRQDADLLLSCGKDNRALCWNPQTSEIVGELPVADNWAFQVQWCPRNPQLLATAYFDGTIGIHSLQSTNEPVQGAQTVAPTPKADGSDIFDVPGFARTTQPTLSLKQPPKWLRRPVSSSFGYGGKLVSVSNLPSAQGKNQSSVVHLQSLTTEPAVAERAKKLKTAMDGDSLSDFAKDKTTGTPKDPATWKALTSLFCADSRDELVTLLGFSKSEIAARVAEAIEKLKSTVSAHPPAEEAELTDVEPREAVVSFAEPENEVEATPSEQSASAASDTTDVTKPADGESTTTVPSLFGDDIGTPQTEAEADFFSTIGTIRSAIPDHVQIPHQNYAQDSSVAATFGSRPSSAASEAMKSNTFRIYPSEESEIDRLLTKALVLGDFESAVTLCLSAERYADAILLAVKGGPELLQQTQKTYFEKRTAKLPYLRLFQSIVTEDLADIVQNADLQEWQEIFVVVCTFAKPDEFNSLAEQLGQRLEFEASMRKTAESPSAEEFRKNATLTYLAARRLERVVNIWIEEMSEEERHLVAGHDEKSSSRYSAHAHALQTFIEKVTVFRSAAKYTDPDLKTETDSSSSRSYRLATLYDRYFEYADLLATQGLLADAVNFLKLIPSDYSGTVGSAYDYWTARERLLLASGQSQAKPAKTARTGYMAVTAATTNVQTSAYPYQAYSAPIQQAATSAAAVPRTTPYAPYNSSAAPDQTATPYAPTQSLATSQQPYQPTASMQPYASAPYGAAGPYQPPLQVPAPPPPISTAASTSGTHPATSVSGALPPPPKKRENGGWNDAPVVTERRTPTSQSQHKPAAIVAPFPNSVSSPGSVPPSPALHGAHPTLPPPPRPGSVTAHGSPQHPGPAPRGGPAAHGPPHATFPPPPSGPSRAFSPSQAPHPGQIQHGPPPPQRGQAFPPPPGPVLGPRQTVSPIQQSVPLRGPPPGQHVPPQQQAPQPRGPGGPGAPPPQGGLYARATPPPSWQGQVHPGVSPLLGHGQGYVRAGSPLTRQAPRSPPQAQHHSQLQPPAGATGPFSPPPGTARPAQQHAHAGHPHPGLPPPQQRQPPQDAPLRGPPPASAGSVSSESSGGALPAPSPKGPAPQKYPPGDRSHIPQNAQNAYGVLFQELNRLKQLSPGRMADDTERRLNVLFDALNCETLPELVLEQLNDLTEAMAARDQQRAMTLHVDLLTSGSQRAEIGIWMSAIKLMIQRL